MAGDRCTRAGEAVGQRLARLLVAAGLGPLLIDVVAAVRRWRRPPVRKPYAPGYRPTVVPGVVLWAEAVERMGADEALRLALEGEGGGHEGRPS